MYENFIYGVEILSNFGIRDCDFVLLPYDETLNSLTRYTFLVKYFKTQKKFKKYKSFFSLLPRFLRREKKTDKHYSSPNWLFWEFCSCPDRKNDRQQAIVYYP